MWEKIWSLMRSIEQTAVRKGQHIIWANAMDGGIVDVWPDYNREDNTIYPSADGEFIVAWWNGERWQRSVYGWNLINKLSSADKISAHRSHFLPHH